MVCNLSTLFTLMNAGSDSFLPVHPHVTDHANCTTSQQRPGSARPGRPLSAHTMNQVRVSRNPTQYAIQLRAVCRRAPWHSPTSVPVPSPDAAYTTASIQKALASTLNPSSLRPSYRAALGSLALFLHASHRLQDSDLLRELLSTQPSSWSL